MQNVLDIPHWLAETFRTLVTLIAGAGINKFYNTWLNRHKPKAEINESQARTTEIIVRSRVAEGDSVVRLINRLELALAAVDRLRAERDGWKAEYDEVYEQKQVLRHQNVRLTSENKGYEEQIRRMELTLASLHQNYDGTKDVPIGPTDEI